MSGCDVTVRPLQSWLRGKPFVLERIDNKGIVLLLGEQRNYTPMEWDCLEGIVPFLRRLPGLVPAGGTYVVGGEPDTPAELLRRYDPGAQADPGGPAVRTLRT